MEFIAVSGWMDKALHLPWKVISPHSLFATLWKTALYNQFQHLPRCVKNPWILDQNVQKLTKCSSLLYEQWRRSMHHRYGLSHCIHTLTLYPPQPCYLPQIHTITQMPMLQMLTLKEGEYNWQPLLCSAPSWPNY